MAMEFEKLMTSFVLCYFWLFLFFPNQKYLLQLFKIHLLELIILCNMTLKLILVLYSHVSDFKLGGEYKPIIRSNNSLELSSKINATPKPLSETVTGKPLEEKVPRCTLYVRLHIVFKR